MGLDNCTCRCESTNCCRYRVSNTNVRLHGNGLFQATVLGNEGTFTIAIDYTFDPTKRQRYYYHCYQYRSSCCAPFQLHLLLYQQICQLKAWEVPLKPTQSGENSSGKQTCNSKYQHQFCHELSCKYANVRTQPTAMSKLGSATGLVY